MSDRPKLRLVAVSDTHMRHEQVALPAGDVLLHAGDFTNSGTLDEVRAFLDWFASQPHRHKVLVAGNHDFLAQREPETFRALLPPGVHYLQDSTVEIEGRRFYGAPWTPLFLHWAFMLPRGEAIRAVWEKIPAGLDVLVTHGPPYGHGDQGAFVRTEPPRAIGCLELLHAVRRARPRLHVFGHIHAGHGVSVSDELPETVFANAATCTERYEPEHPPLVLEVA